MAEYSQQKTPRFDRVHTVLRTQQARLICSTHEEGQSKKTLQGPTGRQEQPMPSIKHSLRITTAPISCCCGSRALAVKQDTNSSLSTLITSAVLLSLGEHSTLRAAWPPTKLAPFLPGHGAITQ